MNILVIGGTRFAGVYLVKQLLADGHNVTLATRGKTADPFGDAVQRLIIERSDAASLQQVLGGKHYDVVYDSQAFSSNEIKFLLDAVVCDKYIMTSTVSVYAPHFRLAQPETDFDPTTYPLVWCARDAFAYDEIKRQAECAMFQAYAHVPSVAVRFPLIIGADDYTQRLYFYVKQVTQGLPVHVDNPSSQLTFIFADEAGKFLAYLADKDVTGGINAANYGTATMASIIAYVEEKSGNKALLNPDAEPAPLNGFPDYGLDLNKAASLGYNFPKLDTALHALLDHYIIEATRR